MQMQNCENYCPLVNRLYGGKNYHMLYAAFRYMLYNTTMPLKNSFVVPVYLSCSHGAVGRGTVGHDSVGHGADGRGAGDGRGRSRKAQI